MHPLRRIPRPLRRRRWRENMHQFASGSSAAVSLLGGGDTSGPPVGPDTVGRPAFELRSSPGPTAALPDVRDDGRRDRAGGGDRARTLETEDVPSMAEVRRLVVRLLGGDEIELGSFDDRDDAMEAAQQLVGALQLSRSRGRVARGRRALPASRRGCLDRRAGRGLASMPAVSSLSFVPSAFIDQMVADTTREGDQRAVRREDGWPFVARPAGQALLARAVRIHQVDLGRPSLEPATPARA